MTRKHFNAIAAAMRVMTDADVSAEVREALEETITRLATVCMEFNSNFDLERFSGACGSRRV